MDLLKHTAKHHFKEQEKEQDEDDVIQKPGDHIQVKTKEVQLYLVCQDFDKKDTKNEHHEKDKEVVMSESMVDDYLLEGY